MTNEPPPGEAERLVDSATLRHLFADVGIEERINRGELRRRVRTSGPPRIPGEPAGTLSLIVAYVDERGRGVAIVHEYLRPDGTLGASGRRDPKWIRWGGTVWKLDPHPTP